MKSIIIVLFLFFSTSSIAATAYGNGSSVDKRDAWYLAKEEAEDKIYNDCGSFARVDKHGQIVTLEEKKKEELYYVKVKIPYKCRPRNKY